MENVIITPQPFIAESTQTIFCNAVGDIGAVVTFTGIVRKEKDVTSLTLTHYPEFTELQIEEAGVKAAKKWNLDSWHVTHRVGNIIAGHPVVFVATAAKHRREAFQATDYLMDFLKSEAPFWKQECRGDMSIWIEPKEQDRDDLKRWND